MKNGFIGELRRYSIGVVVLAMVSAATAYSVFAAEQIPIELKDIGIQEHLGAQVDLNLTFRNEKNEVVALRSVVNGKKPVMLFLAYYGCPNLCNLFLNGATDGLKQLEWSIGKEFQIVTVSIDPREDSKLAAGKKVSHLMAYGNRTDAENGWHFWVNDKPGAADATDVNVKRLAEQVGFRYKYDKDQDQYAHSAGMILLTPEGKVSRYLYGIEYPAKDLKFGLLEAGGGKVGGIADHLLLFCYHYDPKGKKYALYATNVMRAGGGVTVFVVAGFLTSFWRRNRRKNPKESEPTNA